MIRRPALALLLALIPGLASAQFATIAPTPATADNGDRIATTAWARNFLSGGLLLPSGQIFIGSVGGLAVAQTPSADLTVSTGGAFTLATVNANTGAIGSATQCVTVTNNAKGLTTAVSAATCTPAVGSVTGLGTGIATALGVNVGTAGSVVVNGGALGTPSSGTLTSATGLPISTGLTGAGTGVLTALGVNIGSAGAFTTFNGAGGTPSSITLTNGTGLPYAALPSLAANQLLGALTATTPSGQSVPSCSTAASALQWTSGTGFACNTSVTAAAVPASGLTGATLAAAVTASSLTSFGASPALTGTPTAPTAAVDTNTTQIASTAMVLGQAASATPGATAYAAAVGTSTRYARGDHTHAVSLTSATNALGGIVSLSNTTSFFDGPSIAQGTTGTWLAFGQATVYDTAGQALIFCQLWDGTTVIASGGVTVVAASALAVIPLSGKITSPAANLKISCKDNTSISGKISASDAGTNSTVLTAIRLQ